MGFGLKKEGNKIELIHYLTDKANRNNKCLKLVEEGIAYTMDNIIFMNHNLFDYKEFCIQVFNHELEHDAKLTKKDLAIDLFEGSVLTNLAFCFKHPKAFKQFLPFGRINKQWYLDINLLVVYIISITLLTIFFTIF